MSCNCNGCGQPERLCRCPKGKGEAPKRAYIAECTDCDPCRPCESMVKICSFVTPTLTEGQRFRNSFVYNQEDDSVYYISDDGTPTRFGSSPMFINAFNPDDRKIPRQTVFDFANQKAYIYDPEGNYITVDLAASSDEIRLSVNLDDIMWQGSANPLYSCGGIGMYKFETTDVTFTDETTQTTLSCADVAGLLAAGKKVIFDGIPVGFYVLNPSSTPVDLSESDIFADNIELSHIVRYASDECDDYRVYESTVSSHGFQYEVSLVKTCSDGGVEYIFTTYGHGASGE